MKFPVLWSGLGCEMLGDISSYRATLQSEGTQSIHSFFQVQESVDEFPVKAILPAKFDARRQLKSKIYRVTRLVHPNYYDLFDWTIQTREVI